LAVRSVQRGVTASPWGQLEWNWCEGGFAWSKSGKVNAKSERQLANNHHGPGATTVLLTYQQQSVGVWRQRRGNKAGAVAVQTTHNRTWPTAYSDAER